MLDTGIAGRADRAPTHKPAGEHHPGAAWAAAGEPWGLAQRANPLCGERYAMQLSFHGSLSSCRFVLGAHNMGRCSCTGASPGGGRCTAADAGCVKEQQPKADDEAR